MAGFCDSDLDNGALDSANVITQNSCTLSPTFKTPSIRRHMKKEQTDFINSELVTSSFGTDVLNTDCVIPTLNNSALSQHRGPMTSGTPKIPESLSTFLDTENTSWSSSLASTTPQKSNVTYSDLNTEEKQVFIPTLQEKRKPRALFTPDSEEQVLCNILDSSFNESDDLELPKNDHLNSAILEDSYDHIFLLSDGSINETVKNTYLQKEELKERECVQPMVKEVLDLLCSPTGSIRSRKKADYKYSTFHTPHRSGSNISSKKLFSANNSLTVNGFEQGDAAENLISSNMNLSSEDKNQNHSVSHEFLNDISFGTLEEVCRASEMVASTAAPPSFSNIVKPTNLISQVETSEMIVLNELNKHENSNFNFETIPLSKTSTPISDKHKQIFVERISTKKKIKFVSNVEESPSINFGHSEKTMKVKKILSHSQCETEEKVCNNNNSTKLHDVGIDSSVKPLVSEFEENCHETKKFLYFTNENVSSGEQGQRLAESVLNNILTSAKNLETEMPLHVNSNFPSKLIKLKTYDRNFCGCNQNFITFHKLQEVQDFTPDTDNIINEYDIETKNSSSNLLYETKEFTASRSKTLSDNISENNLYFGPKHKDIKSVLPPSRITQDGFLNTNEKGVLAENRKRLIRETFSEGCEYTTTKKLKLKVEKQIGNEKEANSTAIDTKTTNKNEQNESVILLRSKQMTLNNGDFVNCDIPKIMCVAEFEDTDLSESQMLHELNKAEVMYMSNIQLQNMEVRTNITMNSNVTNNEKVCKQKPCRANKSDLTGNNSNINESSLRTSYEIEHICSNKEIESQSNYDKITDIPLPSNILNKDSSGLLEDLDICSSGFLISERLSPTLKSAYKKRKRSKVKQIKDKEKIKRIKEETQLTLENCDTIQILKQNNDKMGEKVGYEHYELTDNRNFSNKSTNLGNCTSEKFNSNFKTDKFDRFVSSHSNQETKPTALSRITALYDPVIATPSKELNSSNKICSQNKLNDNTKMIHTLHLCENMELEESFLYKNEMYYDANESFKGGNTSHLKSKRGSSSPQKENLSASGMKYEISGHHLHEDSNSLPSTRFPDEGVVLNCISASCLSARTEPHLVKGNNNLSSISEKKFKCSPNSVMTGIHHMNVINIGQGNDTSCFMTTETPLKESYSRETKVNSDSPNIKQKSEKRNIEKIDVDTFSPQLCSQDNLLGNPLPETNSTINFSGAFPRTVASIEEIHFHNTNKPLFSEDERNNHVRNTNNALEKCQMLPNNILVATERQNMKMGKSDLISLNRIIEINQNVTQFDQCKIDHNFKNNPFSNQIIDTTGGGLLKSEKEALENNGESTKFINELSLKQNMVSKKGFATASGRPLKVSENSLNKAKKILEDAYESNGCGLSIKDPLFTNECFSSANRKEVKGSNKSLQEEKEIQCKHVIQNQMLNQEFATEAKEILKDDCEITGHEHLNKEPLCYNKISEFNECDNDSSMQQIHLLNKGFVTAGGRLIKVSETALKKGTEILEELTENTEWGLSIEEPSFSNKCITTTREEVATGSKSLLEAKEMIDDWSQIDECHTENAVRFYHISNKGFSTAGGRLLKVSESAIKKAKEILQDASENNDSGDPTKEPILTSKCFSTTGAKVWTISEKPLQEVKENAFGYNLPSNKGFSTAGGRLLRVSESALKKAKEILEDASESSDSQHSITEPLFLNKCFSTAGGKDVTISKKSLLEAREILDNGSQIHDSEQVLSECSDYRHTVKEPLFSNKCFSTAGSKDVTVSEKSLWEVKDILGNRKQIQECHSENVFGYNMPSSKGFSTAGGRLLRVSESALKKAKEILEDASESSDSQHSITEPLFLNKCFSTAGGKDVTIPKKSLLEAREILDNGSQIHDSEQVLSECSDSRHTVKEPLFSNKCFSTAGGKDVTVSEKSLREVKDILGNRKQIQECHSENVFGYNMPSSKGFSTAGGRLLRVSESALKKAKEILEDASESSDSQHSNTEPLFLNKCFSTAGGKDVTISEKSLLEAREIFDNGTQIHNCEQVLSESSDSRHTIKEPLFSNTGFCTARGKDVTVSEKSLREVKEKLGNGSQIVDSEQTLSYNNISIKGFTTAQGRLLTVSECALKKAKEMFEEASESIYSRHSIKEPLFSNKCFSTAGGKDVTVSEKSLREVKEMHGNGKQIDECHSENALGYNMPSSKGFSTAGGRLLRVSESALKKATEILEDASESNDPGYSIREPLFSNKCFSTAGGKDVTVSEKSVLEIKEMLDSDRQMECQSEHALRFNHTSNNCFSTAGGQLRGVSGNELVKGKEILHDVNESTECGQLINYSLFSKLKCSAHLEYDAFLDNGKVFSERHGEYSLKHHHLLDKLSTASGSLFRVPEKSIEKAKVFFGDSMEEPQSSNKCCRASEVDDANFSLMFFAGSEVVDNEGQLDAACRSNNMEFSNELLKRYEISKDTSSNALISGKEIKLLKQHGVNKQEENYPIHCFTNRTTSNVDPCRHSSESTGPRLKPPFCNMSLTQEVSESTAALLADELNGFHENECNELEFLTSQDSCDKEPSSPVLCHEIKRKRKKNRSHKSRMNLPSNLNSVDQTSALIAVHSPPLTSLIEDHNIRKINKKNTNCSYNKPLKMNTKVIQSNIASLRHKAAEEQQEAIEACKNKVKPCKGSLFQFKETFSSCLVPWKKITKGHPPMATSKIELLQYGVKETVLSVSAVNAVEFKFHISEFCRPDDSLVSIPVGDSAEVIPNADQTIGITEVERAFQVSPGVDPALLPEGWIRNHYRWIVWKLASMERSFPYIFAGKCLTLHVVLQQLKYRYDREIDRNQRSALKRILECDDTANKRLTLCVAHISKLEASLDENPEFIKKIPSYEMELTDGWYGIKTCIDTEMVALIDSGKVSIGTKLITYGAELLNCSQGCSPLEEASKTARLRIHTNSTRRTCWDTKLGYYCRPGPFPISLSSVLPAGGLIGSVSVLVIRVYPVIYMEKSADDRTVFHSARIESRKAVEFDQMKQLAVEQIYSQEKAKMLKDSSFKCKKLGRVTKQQLSCITSGEELDALLQGSADPTLLQNMMTEDQRRSLAEYQSRKNEETLHYLKERVQKIVEQKKLSRTSIPLLKVRCTDVCNSSKKCAILSIWRPTEEVCSLFKEGVVLKLFNVSSSGYRSGDLQITSGRQTSYKLLSNSMPSYPHRFATPFDKVISQAPLFGELDCVGVVVHVCPPSSNSQTLFLADDEMSIIGITFWNSIKVSGWLDVLQRQSIVACSNLQWRSGAAIKWVPSAYATEFSLFTQKPSQPHLKDAIEKLREKIVQDINNFTDSCEKNVLSMLNDPNVTPKMIPSLHRISKSSKDSTKSVPQHAHSVETTPVSKKPSEKVNRRLFKLEHYGEPPSLSPLHLCVQKNVSKEFKPPTTIVEETISNYPQEKIPP